MVPLQNSGGGGGGGGRLVLVQMGRRALALKWENVT